MVRSFWQNKKVFITGHTGFKGSWLSLWLAQVGAKTVGYALEAPTKPSLYESAQVSDIMESHIGDIRDFANLTKVMASFQPEIVIHMAAQPLVRYSYSHPVETYMTNVMGTVHVLEAARKVDSIKVIVNVTSDKCYENREWHWGYRENEPMGGYDPYSNSKGCAELVTAAYRQSYFKNSNTNQVALGSGRAGNVIGGGDWAEDRLLPDIMRAVLNKEIIKIRNPSAVRPWQHVLEPLSGYLSLAQKLFEDGQMFAEPFNFGPSEGDAKDVLTIVKMITQLWAGESKYELVTDSNAVHEAQHLKLDCSKAKNLLGWEPRWSLEKTIGSIVEWTEQFERSPREMREVTLKQIKDFETIKTAKSPLRT